MKAEIIHADGRRIDLAGFVDAVTYAELERTRLAAGAARLALRRLRRRGLHPARTSPQG